MVRNDIHGIHRMDVPLPLARDTGGQPVVHQNQVRPQVRNRALGFAERAAVGRRGVARDDVVPGLVLEADDRTGTELAAFLEDDLPLPAVEGDRVVRPGLLVPLPVVWRIEAIVVAGMDRQGLSPGLDDEAVLVGVTVAGGTVWAALE